MGPLVAARLLGAVGDRFTLVALPIFAVTEGGATVAQAALLFTVQSAPGLLSMLLGRPLDHSSRLRAWCAFADLGRCLLLVAVLLAAAFGVVAWPWLLMLAAGLGCGAVVFDVGLQTMLPRVVPRGELSTANTWFARVQGLADVLGPPAVGVVLAASGTSTALLLDAGAFALSGLLLFVLPNRKPDTGGTPARETTRLVGLRRLFGDRVLRSATLAMLLMNLGGAMIGALWTAHVTEVLHVSTATLGVVMALGGISALVASIFVGGPLKRYGPVPSLVPALLLAIAGLCCVPVAGVLSPVPALVVFQIVFSACALVVGVAAATLRQLRTDDAVQGRVFSVVRTGQAAVLPLGGLLASAIAGQAGSQVAVIVGSAIAIASAGLLPWLRAASS